MTGAEDIVFAFLPAQEATQAAELSDRRQTSAPAAEQFMRIGLVPSVPNDAVLGRFENIVERHSELHSAKRGCEVAADFRDVGNDFLPHFRHELDQLLVWKGPAVPR